MNGDQRLGNPTFIQFLAKDRNVAGMSMLSKFISTFGDLLDEPIVYIEDDIFVYKSLACNPTDMVFAIFPEIIKALYDTGNMNRGVKKAINYQLSCRNFVTAYQMVINCYNSMAFEDVSSNIRQNSTVQRIPIARVLVLERIEVRKDLGFESCYICKDDLKENIGCIVSQACKCRGVMCLKCSYR